LIIDRRSVLRLCTFDIGQDTIKVTGFWEVPKNTLFCEKLKN
jgi:hypothetical protein